MCQCDSPPTLSEPWYYNNIILEITSRQTAAPEGLTRSEAEGLNPRRCEEPDIEKILSKHHETSSCQVVTTINIRRQVQPTNIAKSPSNDDRKTILQPPPPEEGICRSLG
ncbi:hypothetical protein BDC45DRAFT_557185 [Circinella umbellata]|nr:hypothetical protein BDC45DRAFT_557185 [Circinella umbellata]